MKARTKEPLLVVAARLGLVVIANVSALRRSGLAATVNQAMYSTSGVSR